MKPGSFLLLTLLLFFLYSDIAAQGLNLRRYCRGYPRRLCPRDYRPICSSYGVTYTNKCHFCNAYVRSGRRIGLRRFGKC
ncbi:ovomucoid-like [Ahaetulla prasina]|uniref:ovomucoid-like n=1 Tax=Ahaetulla prasina TaxID=499056 RepID=UPI002648985F|nr:ovomucoid-like [Ahaetulla prasina]